MEILTCTSALTDEIFAAETPLIHSNSMIPATLMLRIRSSDGSAAYLISQKIETGSKSATETDGLIKRDYWIYGNMEKAKERSQGWS